MEAGALYRFMETAKRSRPLSVEHVYRFKCMRVNRKYSKTLRQPRSSRHEAAANTSDTN
jgi:hypothetical protein